MAANLVFCYQNCTDLLIVLEIEKDFCKIPEFTRPIYSNSESSEQFLVTECFFNLFLEVFSYLSNETMKTQNGKNYWDLETCRKS